MSKDIRQILNSVVYFVKSRANQVCTAPCDGLVLKMHYRWTFFIMMGGFLTVWYQWYYREVITCVSTFNAETQVRLDYINICLSYPYVKTEDGSKRFLAFYRWIHWSFLMLAGIYYIPRKYSKVLENVKVKKLIEDLAQHAPHYEKIDKDLMEKAARYLALNLKTHNKLFVNFLGANVIALVVDIVCMLYLDFLFQGRFLQYGIKAFPFNRDYDQFTDYISQTFPPFVNCELDEMNKLLDNRVETFGCHLTIMELYEKVFFVLWIWLILLIIFTSFYIFFLCMMLVPGVGKYILRISKPLNGSSRVADIVSQACSICKVGDIYLLYRLKQHLSDVRFYELLIKFCDFEVPKYNNYNNYNESPMQNPKLRKRLTSQQDPTIQKMSPDYLKLLIPDSKINDSNNGENKPTVPQTAPIQQSRKPPIGFGDLKQTLKNTSILIE